jgi:hypothetical protein
MGGKHQDCCDLVAVTAVTTVRRARSSDPVSTEITLR